MVTPASPNIMTWTFGRHIGIMTEERGVIFQIMCPLSFRVMNFEGRDEAPLLILVNNIEKQI